MSESLPLGWAECVMGDIAEVIGGGTPDTSDTENFSVLAGVPWLTPADLSEHDEIYVSRGKRFLTEKGFRNSSARLLPKGTVLFSSRAPIGYVAIAANDLSTNQGFKSFVCEKGIDPVYLFFYLKFAKPLAEELASGTTFAEISGKNARQIPVRLAPNNEQRRIAAKLKQLWDKVDACQKRLAKVPILLKRFRQAVLAAACSGMLTADWREKYEASSESESAELPGGWNWQTVHNLVGANGLFDGPFGSNLKTADYTEHGVRVIRLENIAHLKFLAEKQTFISEQKYQTLIRHTVHSGDIIFSSFIDEEIRVCTLPPALTQAIAKADCFCLRPKPDSVDARYLTLQLASRDTYNRLLDKVHGATRPRINTTQLRDLVVPVCPQVEQEEITRRVDELFALADQIEVRFAKAKQYVDGLNQSILAKAFRGELVPQDPNDEPANALLERIREARTNQRPERSRRRVKKSNGKS